MEKISGEFGERHVKIFGGHVEIEDIEKIIKKIEKIDQRNKTISQLFDANKIAGKDHLLHSAKLALEALERKRSFADNPRIELTCWTAGMRQINKSLDKVGINKDSRKVACVIIGESSTAVEKSEKEIIEKMGIDRKNKVLMITEEKIDLLRKAYSISSKQVQVSSVQDVIKEKVSLLSLEQ